MEQPPPKISTYGELAVTPAMVIYITETSVSIGAQKQNKIRQQRHYLPTPQRTI